MIKIFLDRITGKKSWQSFFERLHRLSLRGMHVGEGGGIKGTGEKKALEYVLKKLKTEAVIVFDVGANTGNYSSLVRDIFGEQARIFAFEPSSFAYQQLLSNTSTFHNFRAFNFGFGSASGTKKLYFDKSGSGLASLYQRKLRHFNINLDKSEEIEITTIDDFCQRENIRRINLLKLDVEGHELSVLKGASAMLDSGKVDFIQFEFGGCNIDSRTYFQDFWYLLYKDYDIYRIVKDGLFRIEKYRESYETFLTTNFLAEKKVLKKS